MQAASLLEQCDDLMLLTPRSCASRSASAGLTTTSKRPCQKLLQVHLRFTKHDAWRAQSVLAQQQDGRKCVDSLVPSYRLSEQVPCWNANIPQLLQSLRNGSGNGLHEFLMWDNDDVATCGCRSGRSPLRAQLVSLLLAS